MTVLNRYVLRSNLRDVEAFLKECEERGDVNNVSQARGFIEKGESSQGVVTSIGIDTDLDINKGKVRGYQSGYMITSCSGNQEHWYMEKYNAPVTLDPPEEKEKDGDGRDIPMSLREYYVGEWMKAAISNDNRILTSDYPESKADKIVSLVDAVIERMGRE